MKIPGIEWNRLRLYWLFIRPGSVIHKTRAMKLKIIYLETDRFLSRWKPSLLHRNTPQMGRHRHLVCGRCEVLLGTLRVWLYISSQTWRAHRWHNCTSGWSSDWWAISSMKLLDFSPILQIVNWTPETVIQAGTVWKTPSLKCHWLVSINIINVWVWICLQGLRKKNIQF